MRYMPSEPQKAQRWLVDILHNIRTAELFTEGFTYETFERNRLVFYGVTRCLEIISEASRRLPAELRERHPALPWDAMAAAGNFYRHEYGGVDKELIWGTLQTQLPLLRAVIQEELKAMGVEWHDEAD